MKKASFPTSQDLENFVFSEELFEELQALEISDFPEIYRDSYHAETNENEELS